MNSLVVFEFTLCEQPPAKITFREDISKLQFLVFSLFFQFTTRNLVATKVGFSVF